MDAMNLLPYPRVLKRHSGFLNLPKRATLKLEPPLPFDFAQSIVRRLKDWNANAGNQNNSSIQIQFARDTKSATIQAIRADVSSVPPEGYTLTIDRAGIMIRFRRHNGLRSAVATLRQLLREYGRR